jgi:hypothetical protein
LEWVLGSASDAFPGMTPTPNHSYQQTGVELKNQSGLPNHPTYFCPPSHFPYKGYKLDIPIDGLCKQYDDMISKDQ